ncbi:MAG: mobile mystery protein B [Bacteroidia bacterium]|nr:mobile mystery protein B [Bacteroidia bacterium]
MGLILDYIEGQTPIDEDEKEGLLIPTISTRGELDEFEQANIQQAVEWSIKTKIDRNQLFTEGFLLLIHKKMFNEVWEWAGTKRKTNKNIGVDKTQISVELRKLIDDCNFWIDENAFDSDEIAVRFSHRLVKIHLFPNGNGRHSRLVADIMISKIFNKPVFSWGSSDLTKNNPVRKLYLDAIHEADNDDYKSLILFARS